LGKQAVSLLEAMGYRNLRYYVGGMADRNESGAPAESLPSNSPIAITTSRRLSWLELLANLSLEKLVGLWLCMILVFGLVYWLAGIGMGWGLQAGNNAVKPDLDGLWTAIYFSFVTALSIGYGDVIPTGR
jgi:hypothetical protein